MRSAEISTSGRVRWDWPAGVRLTAAITTERTSGDLGYHHTTAHRHHAAVELEMNAVFLEHDHGATSAERPADIDRYGRMFERLATLMSHAT